MRVGLFGGCFNPVHCGHIAAARAMRDQLQLDRIIFIPSGQPPLKGGAGLLRGEERLAMLELALAEEPEMEATALELERPGPSFTVDTVRELRQALPHGADLFFLLGSDCLDRLPHWKGIEDLHAMMKFAIVQRADQERDLTDSRLVPVTMTPAAISSTMVRERLSRGADVAGMVPPAVAAYMTRQGHYRGTRERVS